MSRSSFPCWLDATTPGTSTFFSNEHRDGCFVLLASLSLNVNKWPPTPVLVKIAKDQSLRLKCQDASSSTHLLVSSDYGWPLSRWLVVCVRFQCLRCILERWVEGAGVDGCLLFFCEALKRKVWWRWWHVFLVRVWLVVKSKCWWRLSWGCSGEGKSWVLFVVKLHVFVKGVCE